MSIESRTSANFELSIQRSRFVVYNLAWVIGAIAKQLGLLSFPWFGAILFLVVANVSTLVPAACYARGVTTVAGVWLRPIWMAFDVLIITWAIGLSGGSESAWYPWYLANAAAAAYLSGHRGLISVVVADTSAYVLLVAVTEGASPDAMIAVLGKMVILFGAAAYAMLAISRQQEKRRVINDLRAAETRRATELEAAIATITASAQRLTEAAEDLSTVSQSMSEGAENAATQAGSVSQAAGQVSTNIHTVASAVDELSAGVREIAHHAQEAADVAKEAVSVADVAHATITKLGQSSSEISTVIETITAVADQTRLLALNANIEAARAGDAGRGFAVVAGEVKKLAHKTAEATDDIGVKITTIQDDAGAAVAAIERITDIITRIHDLQASVAIAVEEQTATTAEISGSISDAARGGSDIAYGITAVAKAAGGTSSGAAAVRKAARELAEMAEDLNTGVVGATDERR